MTGHIRSTVSASSTHTPTTEHRPPTTDHRPPTTDHRPPKDPDALSRAQRPRPDLHHRCAIGDQAHRISPDTESTTRVLHATACISWLPSRNANPGRGCPQGPPQSRATAGGRTLDARASGAGASLRLTIRRFRSRSCRRQVHDRSGRGPPRLRGRSRCRRSRAGYARWRPSLPVQPSRRRRGGQ
jgi:hypothetical protein